jgi:hypothetical protein
MKNEIVPDYWLENEELRLRIERLLKPCLEECGRV